LKVLHIITGLEHGGAESALFRLITYQNNAVEQIVVSMMSMGIYGERLEAAGIKVFALNMSRGTVSFSGLFKLWRIIRKNKPDIIQTWMYHADLIGGIDARFAGCTNIAWSIHNFNIDKGVATNSTRWTAKMCALVSGWVPKKIISCSARSAVVHQKIGYSQEKFVVIPLGYDLEKCKRNEIARRNIRSSWNIDPHGIVLGCVARWDPYKDHKNLLTAFAKVSSEWPWVYCVLVGPGMDKDNKELADLIKKSGAKADQIILMGSSEDIPAVMSAIDLHILSSLGEAFPNVVCEAMACGTPCIVTDVGDASVIVGQTGWVVPPADSEALASAMLLALNGMTEATAWKKRSADCRKHILDNFSMKRMFDTYYDTWKTMLSNP